ncbi:MAG: hypothetical protein NZO58_10585, partial [Gemmataceae bacterium]|nr:hypothetical protein [Gemmataceae bacterium]
LTVLDRLADKDAKDKIASKTHTIEVLPKTFGIGGLVAPAVGFVGQPHATELILFYLPLNAAKQPSAEVTISVLDVNNKPVVPAVVYEFPRDLPVGTDLVKENFVPIRYPMFLNRPGRFTVDIYAKDKVQNKEARLSYTLTVLELSGK